jgi:hypothetical protein
MACIVHAPTLGTNTFKLLEADSPTHDPAGFDEIRRVVLFRGTIPQLLATFDLGTTYPSYPKMFCCGPQPGIESRPSSNENPIYKVPILYRGFINETKRPDGQSYTISTRETLLPITGTRANGSEYTAYAAAKMCPQNNILNPKTGSYWRVRVLDRVHGVRIQGVSTSTGGALPPLPTYAGTAPTRDSQLDYQNLLDPTVNYRTGWNLMNYEVNSQFTLGTNVLHFWTAYFQYRFEYDP